MTSGVTLVSTSFAPAYLVEIWGADMVSKGKIFLHHR